MIDDCPPRLADSRESLLHLAIALGTLLCGLELRKWAAGRCDAVPLETWPLIEGEPFEVVIRHAFFARRVLGHGSVVFAEFGMSAHRRISSASDAGGSGCSRSMRGAGLLFVVRQVVVDFIPADRAAKAVWHGLHS